ncbi:hypothetical protein EIK77_000262 [Talaromyces pinophilus]|nr:hypothetical protein EIK77_000262 [Talaromyces pinophilus]
MPSSLNVAKGSNNNHGRIGFANDGWWGIEVKPQKYAGSFYVQGAYKGDFDVSLQSKITQEVFATAKVKSSGAQHKDWVQYKYELLPKKSASNTNNTLTITFDSKPYIDDTLNQLEFLMGGLNTPYGSWRASLGYPKPWQINYVEIGNEDNLYGGLETYIAYRFQAYYDAITAKYPHMTVMESLTGMPGPAAAASDYHQYSTPDGFVSQFNYFDQMPVTNRTLNGMKNSFFQASFNDINYVSRRGCNCLSK